MKPQLLQSGIPYGSTVRINRRVEEKAAVGREILLTSPKYWDAQYQHWLYRTVFTCDGVGYGAVRADFVELVKLPEKLQNWVENKIRLIVDEPSDIVLADLMKEQHKGEGK